MSTAFAIMLSVLVTMMTSLVVALISPFVLNLLESSETGGSLLFALIIGGMVGFQLYVGAYVGMRAFKKSNITAVGFVLGTLALLGLARNAVTQWNAEGGHWMIVAGTRASQLMVSIAMPVCGTNIATMITTATAIETTA